MHAADFQPHGDSFSLALLQLPHSGLGAFGRIGNVTATMAGDWKE